MKLLLLALVALALLPTPGASAGGRSCDPSITLNSCCDPPIHWASRRDPDRARRAITTEDGGVTLILTNDVVAMQLSDRKLHDVRRKLRDAQREDEDNVLAQVIKNVVIGSVRSMLDHSAECDILDLRDVDYRDGRLVLIADDGDRVFEGIEINSKKVMECFSESDARSFVREFRRVRNRTF